jgi:hypothetical protein
MTRYAAASAREIKDAVELRTPRKHHRFADDVKRGPADFEVTILAFFRIEHVVDWTYMPIHLACFIPHPAAIERFQGLDRTTQNGCCVDAQKAMSSPDFFIRSTTRLRLHSHCRHCEPA